MKPTLVTCHRCDGDGFGASWQEYNCSVCGGGGKVAIDYSVFKHAKSRVKALDKQDAKAALEAQDKKENAKAKKRAEGQCEIRTGTGCDEVRCWRKDNQTHHLIYGIGRKNVGKSILAEHKLRTCTECHNDINAKILKPTTDTDEAAKIRYWRSK